jgi:hypothetical protein
LRDVLRGIRNNKKLNRISIYTEKLKGVIHAGLVKRSDIYTDNGWSAMTPPHNRNVPSEGLLMEVKRPSRSMLLRDRTVLWAAGFPAADAKPKNGRLEELRDQERITHVGSLDLRKVVTVWFSLLAVHIPRLTPSTVLEG